MHLKLISIHFLFLKQKRKQDFLFLEKWVKNINRPRKAIERGMEEKRVPKIDFFRTEIGLDDLTFFVRRKSFPVNRNSRQRL